MALHTGHRNYFVGGCSKDQRYVEKLAVKNHIENLSWHQMPADERKGKALVKEIVKDREGFSPSNETCVWSRYFVDGKPTNPNSFPTLFNGT